MFSFTCSQCLVVSSSKKPFKILLDLKRLNHNEEEKKKLRSSLKEIERLKKKHKQNYEIECQRHKYKVYFYKQLGRLTISINKKRTDQEIDDYLKKINSYERWRHNSNIYYPYIACIKEVRYIACPVCKHKHYFNEKTIPHTEGGLYVKRYERGRYILER